jgi:hypothetical protein
LKSKDGAFVVASDEETTSFLDKIDETRSEEDSVRSSNSSSRRTKGNNGEKVEIKN